MSSDIFKNFSVSVLPPSTSAYTDKQLYVVICRARCVNDFPVRWQTKIEWIGPKEELNNYCHVMADYFDDGLCHSDGIEFRSNGDCFTKHLIGLASTAPEFSNEIIETYGLKQFCVSEQIYSIGFPVANSLSFNRHPNPKRNEYVTTISSINDLTELFSLCYLASVVANDPEHCWYYRPSVTYA